MKFMTCFIILLLFPGCRAAAGVLEETVREDLADLFPGISLSLLDSSSEPGTVIYGLGEQTTVFCSWGTYRGAVLIYDHDLRLTAYLSVGRIREAWLEDLDGSGTKEIIVRLGPRQATSYRLETLVVIAWRGDQLQKMAEVCGI